MLLSHQLLILFIFTSILYLVSTLHPFIFISTSFLVSTLHVFPRDLFLSPPVPHLAFSCLSDGLGVRAGLGHLSNKNKEEIRIGLLPLKKKIVGWKRKRGKGKKMEEEKCINCFPKKKRRKKNVEWIMYVHLLVLFLCCTLFFFTTLFFHIWKLI